MTRFTEVIEKIKQYEYNGCIEDVINDVMVTYMYGLELTEEEEEFEDLRECTTRKIKEIIAKEIMKI